MMSHPYIRPVHWPMIIVSSFLAKPACFKQPCEVSTCRRSEMAMKHRAQAHKQCDNKKEQQDIYLCKACNRYTSHLCTDGLCIHCTQTEFGASTHPGHYSQGSGVACCGCMVDVSNPNDDAAISPSPHLANGNREYTAASSPYFTTTAHGGKKCSINH